MMALNQSVSKRKIWTLIASVAALSLVVTFIVLWWIFKDAPKTEPFASSKVELEIGEVPNDLRIGLVVSQTENYAEGGQWLANAHGVSVAAWRLEQAGVHVETIAVSDQGSSEGAQQAVEELKKQNVSGIIAVTSGPHTQVLVEAAQKANIPIILPYASGTSDAKKGTWYGQPLQADIDSILLSHAQKLHCSTMATTRKIEGINNVEVSIKESGELSANLAENLANNSSMCVFLDMRTPQMANVVYAIKAIRSDIPVFLDASANSWDITKELMRDNGVPTQVFTYGTSSFRARVSSPETSESIRGFNESIEQMKKINVASIVDDTKKFRDFAEGVDTRGYDAFIALVGASVHQHSSNPREVMNGLAEINSQDLPLLSRYDNDAGQSSSYVSGNLLELSSVQSHPVWISLD
ncbi:substrate-binding protein [Arcanobacterium phocae]|uniref:Substrate-binding protein n=1 Tax=Arcanobacterium phocae TaxID=131112 RepID=A0A1H2LCK7_9ACTO|nr:substrate-binding protein [Arcanobacterium phocae]